jgi:hypothetical protein
MPRNPAHWETSVSNEQIIANTICILVQANIFPFKESNAWEAKATKTYPALKTFIHKAYGWRLTAMALRSMAGQNGYALQTIYNVMEGRDNNTNDETITTITQMAAAMTRMST